MRVNRVFAALLYPALVFAQGPPLTDEVPYVQTPQSVVDKMLDLAGVRAGDFVIDLGSGDGRIVITAARRHGARGFGVDLDETLVVEARRRAQSAGVADRVAFYRRDLFETDLRPATVVTLYLLPEYNLKLRPRLLEQLRPGARVVSHDWGMEDWAPDDIAEVPVPDKPVGLKKASIVYMWIVPAQVQGRWRFTLGEGKNVEIAEARIEQHYQKLHGSVRIGTALLPIEDGTLRGADITFRVRPASGPLRFQGRVGQDRIDGTLTTGDSRSQPWRAQRQTGGS